jgi:hypothetical protein
MKGKIVIYSWDLFAEGRKKREKVLCLDAEMWEKPSHSPQPFNSGSPDLLALLVQPAGNIFSVLWSQPSLKDHSTFPT